jgi:transcriptional regulator with XRE-family HTH domain
MNTFTQHTIFPGGDLVKQEYKDLYEKFGLNVVYYCKRRKMTQLQLAELADIDRSHISAIELGNVGVSMDVIFRLSQVLDIQPKDLFDFRD